MLIMSKPLEFQNNDTGGAPTALSKAIVLQTVSRILSTVLSDLYGRWARRPFSASSLWVVEESDLDNLSSPFGTICNELKSAQARSPLCLAILHKMPWAFDFYTRMLFFRKELDNEKLRIQGSNDPMSTAPRSKGIVVRVRKARVLEDGMAALAKVGANIKDRIVIRYVNEFGEDEAGIDIGGLFKDFVTDLSARVYDPSYGLFSLTASNLLYPNPCAVMLFDRRDMEETYVFAGRILGKAMLENITIQPQFAHFFLAFMHGKYNFMNLLNDLSSLDPELFRNLMFLKTYEVSYYSYGGCTILQTAVGAVRIEKFD
jgi:hypothetical protein